MNYHSPLVGNQHTSLSLKSQNVSVLENYTVTLFKETHSDTACIVRIIEIYSLNKLRTNGEKLYSLTGLTVPDTEAVADEINLLLNRFTQVCRREEEELSFRQREVSSAEVAWKSASSKSGAGSIAEARTKNTGRVACADAERCYQSALSRLSEQQDRLNTIRLFPGLLADEVDYIGKGVDKRLLNTFPRSLRFPAEFVTVFQEGSITRDIHFITDALKSLSDAVSEIIDCCSVPVDRKRKASAVCSH
ncbi:hypothetical protein [Yokenella regensburgei]|uniref:hypothetical protein n=1 Tax=Yokenella regensburgei TaxID=158877 RepID=UPI001ED8C4CC|nr:hypothetical protein [Yokenella regensburgei]KAF1366970.1 hypothetical protein FHR25_004506 [Yokenella regensburgei]